MFYRFDHARNDVFQERAGWSDLRARKGLKSLYVFRQVCERGRHARVTLRCRFGIRVLPNFVLAGDNLEGLPGAEAALFDGSPNLHQQLGGRVSKVTGDSFLIHEIPPFVASALGIT